MFPYRKKQMALTIAIMVFGIFFLFIVFATRIKSTPKKLCNRFGDLLYHNQTTGNWTCFPPSERGPCPPDQILTPIPNNHSVGTCVCDNTRDNRRVLLHHKDTRKCYSVFTQGFCKQDEWVVMSPTGIAICAPNICLNQIVSQREDNLIGRGDNHSTEWVPLVDGSCAILGMRHESCPQNEEAEVIRFFKQKLFPGCSYKKRRHIRHRTIFGGPGVSVPQTDCPEGFFKTELGCAVEFDPS